MIDIDKERVRTFLNDVRDLRKYQLAVEKSKGADLKAARYVKELASRVDLFLAELYEPKQPALF